MEIIRITTKEDDKLADKIKEKWTGFFAADSEKRKQLMDHSFRFIIDDVGSGWEYVRIVLDEEIEERYRISYIGPTVKDFVRTIMTLESVELKRFVWSDEPSYIEYAWLLSRQHDVIYIEAPGIKDGFFLGFDYFKKQIRKGFEETYRWDILGI